MKPTIKYNVEYDFLFFTHICANIKETKKVFDSESKTHAISKNKYIKKLFDTFFKETEIYYNETLSYIQKNELNMFFKKVTVFYDYLMHLSHQGKSLDNETPDDFRAFILKELECELKEVNSEKLHKVLRDHYDDPKSFEDYDKSTELILEVFKDERMFNTNFKNAVASLRDLFIKERYLPLKEEYDKKLEEHNEIYKKDPYAFIDTMSSGKVKLSDLNITDYQPYISFLGHLGVMINVGSNVIIYSANLEKLTDFDMDQDLVESLLKFLSDPKRYKMIQMLSKEKWYANELAKKFKITPATMSYHVNKLYALGLITFEQGEQNKLYIELDNDRLNYLLDYMKKDLFS